MTKQMNLKTQKPQPKVKVMSKIDAPKRPTKQEIIINLLKRKQGASLEELIDATQWQSHSVRGHLSNLRKKQGLDIQPHVSDEGIRHYRLIEPQAAA